MVGAILTQNTSWTNVERALARLRAAGALTLLAIRELPMEELEALVRSSGYFRQKAKRLKALVAFIDARYGGSLKKMFATATAQLREELLSMNGVGPETADSILLYAANHEIFVVDAYTRRILERHGAVQGNSKYDEIRSLVEHALLHEEAACPQRKRLATQAPAVHEPSAMSTANRSPLAQTYNEMHGLLVQIGKHYCHKARPHCEECPLQEFLPK